MVQYGVNIGPFSVGFSDIVSVFRVIAELFSSGEDPDENIVQKSVLIENEVSADEIWRSKKTFEITHSMREGLKVLYQYNSEALGARTIFKEYSQKVHFCELPAESDSTIFFLARSAVQNKGDHHIDTKDAIGFLALFQPPVPKGSVVKYTCEQSYRLLTPLWGKGSKQLHKDWRFLRETHRFTRIIHFPKRYYEGVRPEIFLMDGNKTRKIIGSQKIAFTSEVKGDTVTWKAFLQEAKKDTVLRIRWERPI